MTPGRGDVKRTLMTGQCSVSPRCLTGLTVAKTARLTLHVLRVSHGVPGRDRTCNLLIRSQVLYPIELRVHQRERV